MNKSIEALRTIGETSKILSLPVYVIRFWEKKFIVIKPIKKTGGTRYYNEMQIDLLKKIKYLLYDKKYSIEGANQVLNEKKKKVPLIKKLS